MRGCLRSMRGLGVGRPAVILCEVVMLVNRIPDCQSVRGLLKNGWNGPAKYSLSNRNSVGQLPYKNFSIIIINMNRLNIVLIGSTQSGKSTILTNLICESNHIPKKSMDQITKQASAQGRNTFSYPWVRYRLQTKFYQNTPSNMKFNLKTSKHNLTLVDTCSDLRYIKNTIDGMYMGDCAVLIIPAIPKEFDDALVRQENFAMIANIHGVKRIIVCVNKMDASEVAYSQQKYQLERDRIKEYLRKVGYGENRLQCCIPVSGQSGDNLTVKSKNMPWYEGPTLYQALDALAIPERFVAKPLRIAVQESFRICGVGTIIVGLISSGVVKTGMKVNFAPSGLFSEVASLEINHEPVKEGHAGDYIGLHFKSLKPSDIKRGSILSDFASLPPKSVFSFTAHIVLLNCSAKKVKPGYRTLIDCHMQHIACQLVEIKYTFCKNTGKRLVQKPQFMKNSEAAAVVLRFEKPIVCEVYKEDPALGRFSMRQGKRLIGAGKIIEIQRYEDRTE